MQGEFSIPEGSRTRHSTEQSVVIPEVHEKPVHVVFDEALTTSDGGALLLKLVDEKIGATDTLAAFTRDAREPGRVSHIDLRRITVYKHVAALMNAADTPAA